MTASNDLQRRLARYYETEPPTRAPDWVLQSALSTIETTRQQRGLAALRRYPAMPTYLKFGAAAALAIAVGAFALWQMAPSGPGASPKPAATQTPVPTDAPSAAASPTARPEPTTYVPGALTRTFTSSFHGFSLGYPGTWLAQAATGPWDGDPPAVPAWMVSTRDKAYDAALEDHLFISVASRPLDGTSLEKLFVALYGDMGCTLGAGGTIDGADRVVRVDCADLPSFEVALASSGGRGYVFELRASQDDVELQTLDTAALFDAILATVELHPEDAVDG